MTDMSIRVIHGESISRLQNEMTQFTSKLPPPAVQVKGASSHQSRALDLRDATQQVQSIGARHAQVIGRQRASKYQHNSYRTFLGTIVIDRRSWTEALREKPFTEERQITFLPSIFKTALEMQFSQLYGRISRTLTIYPTLGPDSPIFEMCHRGNLAGLQDAFSNRQYSPYTLDQSGQSLLHVSGLEASQRRRQEH